MDLIDYDTEIELQNQEPEAHEDPRDYMSELKDEE